MMDKGDGVVEFIRRRFPEDCRWLDGNCYYFAVILRDRFPAGRILYDVVAGHFVTEIGGVRYDWSGVVDDLGRKYVAWDEFEAYDRPRYERVVEGCVA